MEAVRDGSPYPLDVTIDIPPDVRMPASPPCAPLSAVSFDPFAAGPSAPLAIPTKLPSLATKIRDRKAIEMSNANSVDGGRVRNTEIRETQGVDMGRAATPSAAFGEWSDVTVRSSVFRLASRNEAAEEDDGSRRFDERDASDLLCFAAVCCSSL